MSFSMLTCAAFTPSGASACESSTVRAIRSALPFAASTNPGLLSQSSCDPKQPLREDLETTSKRRCLWTYLQHDERLALHEREQKK